MKEKSLSPSSSSPSSRPWRPSSRKGRNAPQLQSDPVRDMAFEIVRGVMEHRRMLETTLDRSGEAEARDRAAAHRLAATTLRHWGSMNEMIGPLLRKEPPMAVRCALLLGVAQLIHLQTPPHAAVGTIVDLLHRCKLSPFSGLANAVLRRVSRESETLQEGLDQERLDVPAWLWSAWGRRARAITKGFYQEAPLDLTLRPGSESPEDGETLPGGTLRFPAGTKITTLPGFEEGAFWAQDVAASFPVRLMGDIKGLKIADLCAAPGGKTAQLVCEGAEVTALERDAMRAKRLRENLARLGLRANLVVQDALTWRPEDLFDAVLLDAPCSATGTLRRHPDVLWVKRPRDVKALAEGQDAFIKAARDLLREGGMLLYAVCSLQDEEGSQRIEAALERGGWRLLPFTQEELALLPEARTKEGYFRTHPGLWAEKGGMDGFFAARLIKENR